MCHNLKEVFNSNDDDDDIILYTIIDTRGFNTRNNTRIFYTKVYTTHFCWCLLV